MCPSSESGRRWNLARMPWRNPIHRCMHAYSCCAYSCLLTRSNLVQRDCSGGQFRPSALPMRRTSLCLSKPAKQASRSSRSALQEPRISSVNILTFISHSKIRPRSRRTYRRLFLSSISSNIGSLKSLLQKFSNDGRDSDVIEAGPHWCKWAALQMYSLSCRGAGENVNPFAGRKCICEHVVYLIFGRKARGKSRT